MSEPLLNENQRRRVGTHLRLLDEDLAALELLPALRRPGEPYDRIGALLAELRRRTAEARRALDLPADTGPTLRRRVAAIAETWAAHLEDLRPARLKAYGAVHRDLARHLEPHLDGLVALLYRLADTAARLPEG
jgi:hypothetical protein